MSTASDSLSISWSVNNWSKYTDPNSIRGFLFCKEDRSRSTSLSKCTISIRTSKSMLYVKVKIQPRVYAVLKQCSFKLVLLRLEFTKRSFDIYSYVCVNTYENWLSWYLGRKNRSVCAIYNIFSQLKWHILSSKMKMKTLGICFINGQRWSFHTGDRLDNVI